MDGRQDEEATAMLQIQQHFAGFHKIDKGLFKDEEPSIKRRKQMTMQEISETNRAHRLMEVDLASARSEIATLEARLVTLETNMAESQIEAEQKLESTEYKLKHERQTSAELRRELEASGVREKAARDELATTRRKLSDLTADVDKQRFAWNTERARIQDEGGQALQEERASTLQLQRRAIALESELAIAQKEVETAQLQAEVHKSRNQELLTSLREMEGRCQEAVGLERKNRELEMEVARQREEVVVAQALKSQLARLPQLERENEDMARQLRAHRLKRDTSLVLEEKVLDLSSRLELARSCSAEVAGLQAQNEALQQELARWQTLDSQTAGRKLSASETGRQLAELQTSSALLLEQKGELASSMRILQQQLAGARAEKQGAEAAAARVASDKSQVDTRLRIAARKLALVIKDRDHLKGVLTSYEHDMTTSVSDDMANRLAHAHQQQAGAVKRAEEAEATVERLLQEVSSAADRAHLAEERCTALEREVSVSRVAASAAGPADDKAAANQLETLRQRVLEMESELQKEKERRGDLEAAQERRLLQGDYDPTKTKVLHVGSNLATQMKEERAQLVVRLQQERRQLRDDNAVLKERVRVLEEGQMEDVTMRVEERIQGREDADPEEIRALRGKLHSAELRLVRYKEAAERQCQMIRKAFTELAGYKLNVSTENGINVYRLHSVFGALDDILEFRYTSAGGMELASTPFALSLYDLRERYLDEKGSIPCFLAGLTLQLFPAL